MDAAGVIASLAHRPEWSRLAERILELVGPMRVLLTDDVALHELYRDLMSNGVIGGLVVLVADGVILRVGFASAPELHDLVRAAIEQAADETGVDLVDWGRVVKPGAA